MTTVRPIDAEDWRVVKELRLRALRDAPYAFAETLSDAVRTPDSDWRSRALVDAEAIGSTCALAIAGPEPVGMAVGVRDAEDRRVAHLLAMWVAPGFRGTNTAASLLSYIADWARGADATILRGYVTEHNARAIAFYRKAGFQLLLERRPWEPDRTKSEVAMQRRLSP